MRMAASIATVQGPEVTHRVQQRVSSVGVSRVLLLCCGAAWLVLVPNAGASSSAVETWQRSRMEASNRVGQDVIEALADKGIARVLVLIQVRSATSGEVFTHFNSSAARLALRNASDDLLRHIERRDFTPVYRYSAINAVAGEVSPDGVIALLGSPLVKAISLDAGGTGGLLEAAPLTGMDTVRQQGFTGKGVTVAVLDSGIAKNRSDLKKARKAERCFCSTDGGCCPDGSSFQTGKGSAADDEGHGTWITGIIASRGKKSPRGCAPKAKVVAIKVLDEYNRYCCSSDILAALDWIITKRQDVDIVNMSLGTSKLFKGNCDRKLGAIGPAFATAVKTLMGQGVMVFAASGNEASRKKMAMPACIENTVSVGASYDEEFGKFDWGICSDHRADPNHVTCFSNTNRKTDLVAPGALITSARLGGGVMTGAGTSAATAMAAACAALLKQAYSNATPEQLEQALGSSSHIATDSKSGRSYPRLDCEEAFDFLEDLH